MRNLTWIFLQQNDAKKYWQMKYVHALLQNWLYCIRTIGPTALWFSKTYICKHGFSKVLVPFLNLVNPNKTYYSKCCSCIVMYRNRLNDVKCRSNFCNQVLYRFWNLKRCQDKVLNAYGKNNFCESNAAQSNGPNTDDLAGKLCTCIIMRERIFAANVFWLSFNKCFFFKCASRLALLNQIRQWVVQTYFYISIVEVKLQIRLGKPLINCHRFLNLAYCLWHSW